MSNDSTVSSGSEALLQPSAAPAGRVRWRLDDIELDEHRLELRVNGVLTPIEPKPLELLRFLLRRVGEVVTREEILAELWPGRVVTDAVVTNCVGKLRTALNDSDQLIVRTMQRFGYLLAGEVLCEPVAIPEGLQATETTLTLLPGDPVPFRPGWQLSRRLGGGGHGEVWLAFDAASKEERVFKFCETPDDLSALKRELTLQRVLNETLGPSDYFVPLLGHNLEAAPFFLEMPFFTQGNLGEWLQSRGGVECVPMDRRLELIAQCAEAVAAAHSAGVLHKDLKPSNVLIVVDSDCKPSARLCDFGSGRMLDPDLFTLLGLTRRGFTRTLVDTDITPMYLAPEVIAGQPPTAMADIYALGIMLYQMVAGDLRRPLAPGWEADVADPILREDISLAAAGSLRRRLSNAGQLATRLRSLAARRAEVETQRRDVAEADRLRRQLEVWQARRGLISALVAVLIAGAAFGFFHYTQTHMGQDDCPASCSGERPQFNQNRL